MIHDAMSHVNTQKERDCTKRVYGIIIKGLLSFEELQGALTISSKPYHP